MLTRLLHAIGGATTGAVVVSGVLTYWRGEVTDWTYVIAASAGGGVVGLLFGYSILDTFKSVARLR